MDIGNTEKTQAKDINLRWGLIATLRKQKPAKIAKTLILNVVLSISLFIPIFVFLGARSEERIVSTNDKLPWVKFFVYILFFQIEAIPQAANTCHEKIKRNFTDKVHSAVVA